MRLASPIFNEVSAIGKYASIGVDCFLSKIMSLNSEDANDAVSAALKSRIFCDCYHAHPQRTISARWQFIWFDHLSQSMQNWNDTTWRFRRIWMRARSIKIEARLAQLAETLSFHAVRRREQIVRFSIECQKRRNQLFTSTMSQLNSCNQSKKTRYCSLWKSF